MAAAAMVAAAVLALPALASTDPIAPYAGTGPEGFGGDGAAALGARFDSPDEVSLAPNGALLIADTENHRIRRVAPDGTISTVAGTGSEGYNGDMGLATAAKLKKPAGVAALPTGGFLIADTGNNRIRRVSSLGTIETVAGSGSSGYGGDGGLAPLAKLDHPQGVAATVGGGYLIADTENNTVRSVNAFGAITTVAGDGQNGLAGDGGPATAARLDEPQDVAPLPEGGFLIADSSNGRIRTVDNQGVISTVAATTVAASATSQDDDEAPVAKPSGVVALPSGGFLYSDEGNDRVWQVDRDGAIEAFAGTGVPGSTGDGGPAASARLNSPADVTASSNGQTFISDGGNHRIRWVAARTIAGNGGGPPPGNGAGPPVGGTEAEPGDTEAEPGDTEAKLPSPRRPVTGVRVTIRPASGRVLVRLPGSGRFVALESAAGVPMGSTIDTRRGRVRLASVRDAAGHLQAGTFWDGLFQVRQRRRRGSFTDLQLRGPRVRACARRAAAGHGSGPRAAVSRKRSRRRLWAKDSRGRFRTHGRNGVATTRGTLWLTEERCAGTLFRVRRGAVLVRVRDKRKQVRVDAGESYLARRAR